MKLHLPKQLFTALIATLTGFTLATGAAYGALTTTTTNYDADGNVIPEGDTTTEIARTEVVDQYDGAGNTAIDTTRDVDKIIFNMDANVNSNWFQLSNRSPLFEGEVQIGDGSDNTKGLVITAASNNVQPTFSGKVTGSGRIYYTSTDGTNVKFTFSGDVTEYEGDVELDTKGGNFTLAFGNGGAAASTNTETAGVAGTGAITFLTDKNTLTFNYDTNCTAYVTNAISAGEDGVSKVTVTNGDMVFTKENQIDILTITAGSAAFTNNVTLGSISGAGSLSFGANTMVSLGSAIGSEGGVSFADGATIDYVGDISNLVTSYAHGGYGYGTAVTLDLLASTTADREVTVSVYGQGSYTMNTDGTVSGVTDTTGNYYIAGNVNSSTILSSGDDLTTMSSLLVKSGTLTVDEAWTVPALQGTAGTIALSENLTISEDSTLTGTILQGAGELIIGAGATLTVNSTARNMKSNIRVGSGATLEFLGTGADAIEYAQTGRTIYVDGGKIDVGTTRQTVGNWTFALTGAMIQGAGQSSHANVGLDFHSSSTINVYGSEGATGENPTISTINTKVRIASGHTLTYDVAGTARLNQSGALQIDGTISKDGAGVLYLSGSNSGSGALNVVEGTLAVNAIAALASSTVTVQDGAVLDLTEVYGDHLVLTEWEAIENNANLVTQEGGFIKVRTDHNGASGGELNLDADGIKLTKNYLTSRVDVHAGGNTDGRALTIGSGATLKSTGEIKMVSNGKLVVDGGNLIAEYLTMGHTAGSIYPGYLEMSSGSIKTGYIQLINNNANTISISGGALEFTTSSAIRRNSNTSTTISIGGTAEDPVTLKASQVAWTLNGDSLTAKPTIGHATIDGANTYGITLQNVNINGTITNNANLESQAAGLTLGAFTVAADATATFSGTGTTALAGTVTNNGTLNMSGFTVAADTEATFSGTGTTTLSGTVTNNGTLNMSGFTVAAETEATFSGTGTTTLTGAITNNASLILGENVVWNSGATVSNNGTLQINKGTGDLVLNNIVGVDAGTYRQAVVTNTEAGNLIIVNTGNKSLSRDITISNGGKVTLKGGTFGTADAAITNNIVAGNSTTLVLDGVEAYLNKAGDTDQILDINTELTNGSVMHMLADERLDWGGLYTTTVGLNSLLDVGSTRQSLSGNTLKLAGGTIYGTGGTYPEGSYTAGLDYRASGTITVTENSLIATAVASRETDGVVTLDVAANKTLTIGSYTAGDTTNTGSFVGAGKFDKTGNGTVLYKGSAFTNTLDIKAGVFEYYVEDERTHTGSITDSGTTSGDTTAYNGTFKKSGAGTLTLTNATVTMLNVAGGKLVYELADNAEAEVDHTLASFVVNSGATFEKTGAGTLNAGNLVDGTFSGGIVVNEGVLQFNGYGTDTTTEDFEVVPPRFVQLVQNLTTTGTGKVDITGRVSFNWTGSHAGVRGCTIGSYISIEDDLQINTYPSNADADGDTMCRWEVVDGGRLEVGDVLWLTNKQKLVVAGGSVTVDGGLKLGHGENGSGTYGNTLYSKLSVKSGSLSTTGLTFVGGANSVCMTGGTITFTPAADGGEVLIDGKTSISSAGAGTLDFTGGTLAATTAGWTLTGTETMAVSLGNVEFDIAAGKTVTLAGDYNLTGTLSLTGHTVTENETTTTGTLALTGTMQIAALDTLKEGGSSYGGGTVSGNGFLEGNFYLVENLDAANIDTSGLTVKLGNSEVDASRVTLSETGKHLMLSSSGAGVFYVNSGTEAATDAISWKSGFVNYHVAQGATLSITPGDTLSATNAQNALLSTIGDGTISLNGNLPNLTNLTIAAGSVSQATGKLAITGGATLTMDAGDGSTGGVQHKTHQYNLSSFTSVELDGGTIQYHGAATTLNNVTVTENGAHITFRDVNNVNNAMTLAGTTTLNGTLTLDTLSNDPDTNINAWKYGVDIARLTGSGTLDIHSTDYSNNTGETAKVSIQDLSGFTGAISLSKHVGPAQLNLNNLSGTLGLKTIAMDGGAQTTLSVNADTEATMATVISGNGSVTKQGAGKLTLSGASSYTGTTTVSAGELALAAGASLGSGAVTVASGASLSLGENATLSLSSGTSSLGTLTSGSGSKINLAGAATLNRISSGNVELEGYGTYDFGDFDITGGNNNTSDTYNSAIRVTYGDGWFGTVKFGSGSTFTFMNLDLNAFANGGNSTIELAGVTGYLQSSTSSPKTYEANFKLTGNGFTINNGYGGSKYKFTGDFGGSGNLTVNKDLDSGLEFTFAGDMSQWTGELKHQLDSQNKYIYDAAEDVADTSIGNKLTAEGSGTANAMNVVVKTAKDVTMAGELRAKDGAIMNVTKENNGDLAIKSVAVEGTGMVKVNGLSISATDSAAATSGAPAGLTAKADTNGTLTYLAEEASFTIEDMTLTNTTVTAATVETKVKLQNVEGSTALLAKGAFTLHAAPTVGMAPTAESHGTLSYTNGLAIATDANASLTLNLDVVNAVAGDAHGTYDLTITLSGFGEGFAVTEGILDMVGFDSTSWLGQALVSQKAEYTVVTEQTPATAGEGGVPTVSYAAGTGASVGSLVITITGLNVPEPATSTLSLLALAALAARRRRND